jgi:hypothetical protein
MEVRMGFSLKVGPESVLASVGPSSDTTSSAQGPTVSLSGARASVAPAPALAEEAGAVEEEVAPLPEEAVGVPAGAQAEIPQRPPPAGNTEEGLVTPPHEVVPGPVVAPTIVLP